MTTGYDCPDVLNVVLMKPVFSPSDFIQMKGRGTRKHDFLTQWTDRENPPSVQTTEKTRFKLFDFFGNCEYFEEKFNYDEVLKLPVPRLSTDKGPPPVQSDPMGEFHNEDHDPLVFLKETDIGHEGLRVDREPYQKFREQTTQDSTIQDLVSKSDWDTLEDYMVRNVFDKPAEYFNLDKIRKSLGVDRRISVRELMEFMFGRTPYIKNKYELLEEEFEKFDDRYIPESDSYPSVKNFFYDYVTDSELREIIESKQYAKLNVHPLGQSYKELPNQYKNLIPDYIKNHVPLNKFMN